jgi:hypothetical protein
MENETADAFRHLVLAMVLDRLQRAKATLVILRRERITSARVDAVRFPSTS